MIIKLIIQAIMAVLGIFFNMIPSQDTTEVISMYMNALHTLIEVCSQGANFVHFLVGDSVSIILPAAIGLLTLKFILLPILDFIRRLIPFVNL